MNPTDVARDDDPDWLTLSAVDGPMRVYRVRPNTPITPAAAVVVLQEAFGVNEHIQDVARRIASEGFLALAPDLFHRTGVRTVNYADRAVALDLINAIGPAEIDSDIAAVLTHLQRVEHISVERTSILGFCFGGRAAFTAAGSSPGLASTTIFYGPGIAAGPHAVLDRAQSISGPVLLLVGEEDPTIPAVDLTSIRLACEQAGVDLRTKTFPGAGHAFHCDARPAMYRSGPAQQAWSATVELLTSVIVGSRS